MKKIISLILALVMVLSLSTGVLAERSPDEAKNNICITGSVAYANDEIISVAIENEDGITVFYSKFACVNPNGSYTIHLKCSGDVTKRAIKLTYAGADVTDTIKTLTSVTDLVKADVEVDGKNANIDIKDKFCFEEGATVLAVSYDESGKLVGAKTVTDKTKADEIATTEIAANATNTKAFCWNKIADLREYNKQFENLLPKVNVFCIGDSFGQTWAEKWYPESGWGTHIGDYFTDRAVVSNFCTSGGWAQAIMSNESDPKYQQNIADGKNPTSGMYGWNDWKDMEKSSSYSKGDYVIVSLGLNDAKREGPDGMDPVQWYGMALEEMAKRAEKRGVNLILCSPLQRATTKMDPTSKMFATKTEEIAKKYGLVYINALEALQKQYSKEFKTDDEVLRKYYLHREELLKPVEQGGWGLTMEQIENHGQEAMRPGASGKNEHPNINGANNFARTMVELLKNTDSGLKAYIKE